VAEGVNIFTVVEQGDIQTYKTNIDQFDIDITDKYGASLLHKQSPTDVQKSPLTW
jgi:hypothetical protein